MTQYEFYKSFQFVAELLLAELLYVYRLPRRSFFPLRLIGGLGLLFLFSWLFPILSEDAFYCSFMFLTIFAATVPLCKFLFRTSWLTVVFCCIAGYTTQHIAYEFYTIALNIAGANGGTPMGFYGSDYVGMYSNPFLLALYFAVYVITFFACFFLFSERLNQSEGVTLKTMFVFLFSIFIFVIDILLNAIIIYYMTDAQKLYLIIVGIYNILCCFVSLYLQFAVALEGEIRSTLQAVQRLYLQAKEQYASSKANIEAINVRCHDLKHLIYLLEHGETVASPLLKDIKGHISVYESEAKTGNVALDIILTEKGLLCNKNDIKLSCLVDGRELSFMAEEDIYVLFGNIIDNAIEAVMKLPPEKRVIALRVRPQNGFLVIKESNYYLEELRFRDGLPQTSKQDKTLHGFGMKSIGFLCKQYDGNFLIETRDGIFHLNVMLRRKAKQQ